MVMDRVGVGRVQELEVHVVPDQRHHHRRLHAWRRRSACSGVCDSTPGSRISCQDGSGNVVGSYDNIP